MQIQLSYTIDHTMPSISSTLNRLHTPMNSRNPRRQILKSSPRNHKPSFLNHIPKLLLRRKPLNTLDQILITSTVPSNQLPNQGNCAKAPPLIDSIKQRIINLTKLHTSKHPARLQNAERLVQCSLLIREISDPKHNRVQIHRVIRDRRHVFGVGFHEGETIGVVVGCVDAAFFALG